MRRDDWLIHQLPVAMAENDFFVRFLTIFQEMSDTVYQQIDGLADQFDPAIASPQMVRAMGAWLGVDWVDSYLPEKTQRRIIREYSELIPWRGTKRGLRQLLELITDGEVHISDNGGVFPEGEAPGGASTVLIEVESTGFVTVDDLIRIVRDELPAFVLFRLLVDEQEVWPTPPEKPAAVSEREEVTSA
jgi:phage tail-like protein